MISADALHLGPFMLPWNLVIIVLALALSSVLIRLGAKKYVWSASMQKHSQDLIWSSFIVGVLGARVVFILLHAELYWAMPLDIFKFQDKGFHLWGGITIAAVWYFIRNHAMSVPHKLVLTLFCTGMIALGLGIRHVQPKVNFPDVSLIALDGHTQTQTPVQLAHFKGQPTVVNLWASWCPPCHREMPVLARAAQQYPHIHFVMLNQGEDQATVRQYLQHHNF